VRQSLEVQASGGDDARMPSSISAWSLAARDTKFLANLRCRGSSRSEPDALLHVEAGSFLPEVRHAGKIESAAKGGRRRPGGEERQNKKSDLKGASRSMANTMSEKQLEEFASTKRKGKPEHISKSK
jgi:hypothetical protein